MYLLILRAENLIASDLIQAVHATHLHSVLQFTLQLIHINLHALGTAP